MASPRIWFITGASSGFGRFLTELVLRNGDIAIATLRSPAVLSDLSAIYTPDKLLVLKLDVSKPQEIVDAFTAAQAAFGRIDVVFNNAGYSLMSEVEGAPDDVARAMFEVNFWGAANVSREAIRFFRDVNQPMGGRLLQVSSAGGLRGLSALGHYSASRFALEGLTEALASELQPEWNIKVTLVELGGFLTNAGRNMVRIPPHPAYVDPVTQVPSARAYFANDPEFSHPVKGVAVIYRIAAMSDPPLHFPLGGGAVKAARKKGEALIAAAAAFEPYSEGLEVDSEYLKQVQRSRENQ
ncbi:NAD(P)-binding protein [Wolfiporia cocos MD-104 SS10]|uniref:NAD(P)-binding protein n=1 Tax=Wolfiporia cocos (strain MD-104) TaxID=742152 RepID=A0A2H3JX56_WOLCO|nr:NAD(P)-binding protein [Wolfiporia cocos MD-104 SS10]